VCVGGWVDGEGIDAFTGTFLYLLPELRANC